jgi:Domain of unknown function (DUF4304)
MAEMQPVDELVRELKSHFVEMGFRCSKRSILKELPTHWIRIHFQRSQWSAQYYVNLYITLKGSGTDHQRAYQRDLGTRWESISDDKAQLSRALDFHHPLDLESRVDICEQAMPRLREFVAELSTIEGVRSVVQSASEGQVPRWGMLVLRGAYDVLGIPFPPRPRADA